MEILSRLSSSTRKCLNVIKIKSKSGKPKRLSLARRVTAGKKKSTKVRAEVEVNAAEAVVRLEAAVSAAEASLSADVVASLNVDAEASLNVDAEASLNAGGVVSQIGVAAETGGDSEEAQQGGKEAMLVSHAEINY